MEAPQYQPPPAPAVDPNTATLAENAQRQDIAALKETTAIDTSSIMTRYGMSLAFSGGAGGSPLAVR